MRYFRLFPFSRADFRVFSMPRSAPTPAPEMPAKIDHADFYAKASSALSSLDADWARLVERVGPCLHESKPAREPYEALIRAVSHQQLHAKAAESILGRFIRLFFEDPTPADFPAPKQVVSMDIARIQACGFSAKKAACIVGIALAAESGLVPSLADTAQFSDEALIERLVALPGIGRWTVEMFLIYSLERMDILPVDDFGVREGFKRLKGLSAQPTRGFLAKAGVAWSPYRTIGKRSEPGNRRSF